MTPAPRRRLRLGPRLPWLTSVLLASVLLTAPAAAQQLSGVAIGPDGEPLADVTVVLHRVGGGGGAFVGTDTTSPTGAFRFDLESAEPAVYFAALRYEDRLYMGPAVQGGGEPITDYEVRVEPGSEAGAVASALGNQLAQPGQNRPVPGGVRPGGAGPSDAGAFLLVGLLALGAAAAFMVAAPRYRDRRTRDTLVELARAENTLAEPGDEEDRARAEARRDRLRKQLAPRT